MQGCVRYNQIIYSKIQQFHYSTREYFVCSKNDYKANAEMRVSSIILHPYAPRIAKIAEIEKLWSRVQLGAINS